MIAPVLLLLLSSAARVPLACTSTVTRVEEVPGSTRDSRVEEVCVEPTSWLDVAVGIELVALQLTGGRQVVTLGAAPSLGLAFGWRPAAWTATPALLGAELALAMTLISPEIAEGMARHVEIWLVPSLTILGWFSIGLGGRFGIAVRDAEEDFARLVLTGGLRLPL